MKRILSIVISLAMLVVLFAGCAQTDPTTINPTTKPTTATTAATTAEPTEPTEPVTPTVTWMMRQYGNLMYENELKVYEWLGEAGNLLSIPSLFRPMCTWINYLFL